jgi:hypothetical protein
VLGHGPQLREREGERPWHRSVDDEPVGMLVELAGDAGVGRRLVDRNALRAGAGPPLGEGGHGAEGPDRVAGGGQEERARAGGHATEEGTAGGRRRHGRLGVARRASQRVARERGLGADVDDEGADRDPQTCTVWRDTPSLAATSVTVSPSTCTASTAW